MLGDMDSAGSIPPEALSGMLSSPGAAGETAPNSKSSTTSTKPTSPSAALSFQQQTQLLTPKAIFESIGTQLLGEATPEQKEAQQKQMQKIQQSIARAQQDWERYKSAQSAEEQQRIQTTIELKDQALKLGSYDQTSAVKSQTTQGDLSEQTLVTLAMKNAQEAKEREQKARSAMSSSAAPKGAQAEGGQKKTSMIANMLSGKSSDGGNKLSDDKDARQRQREQAMGE
jgi:hypothetical protein